MGLRFRGSVHALAALGRSAHVCSPRHHKKEGGPCLRDSVDQDRMAPHKVPCASTTHHNHDNMDRHMKKRKKKQRSRPEYCQATAQFDVRLGPHVGRADRPALRHRRRMIIVCAPTFPHMPGARSCRRRGGSRSRSLRSFSLRSETRLAFHGSSRIAACSSAPLAGEACGKRGLFRSQAPSGFERRRPRCCL